MAKFSKKQQIFGLRYCPQSCDDMFYLLLLLMFVTSFASSATHVPNSLVNIRVIKAKDLLLFQKFGR